ncbi:MAG: response regulator transcription factor [Clostridiales bacterium]|nr:response regulator transcription factor [Clostridiales bacterium]
MYRILLVEDDPVIAQEVARHLTGWGYEVVIREGFLDLETEFEALDPHLVLMDLMLPGRNGFHWCREIRKLSPVPILFITSAGDNMNAVTAMGLGADDLLAKPFDLSLLTAKVEALLRRSYGYAAPSPVLSHRGLEYDRALALVRHGDREAELTRNEHRILQTLLQNKGSIVPREELMVALWEDDSYVDDNTLTVNVARLRRKLADIGLTDFIETKKGMGYLLP